MSHFADSRRLREEAYPDSTNLMARVSIYDHREPPLDIWGWALDHTDWAGGQRVLDVGCGPGTYLGRLAEREPALLLVGADLSEGMAREASAAAPALAGSVQALPFADGGFDRVLAMHMLYHAPDIPAAVRELRRVLRPGGVLLVVTNGERHLEELDHMISVAGSAPDFNFAMNRFTLENGRGLLGAAFDGVVLDDVGGELVVPEVEPVIRYLESSRSLIEAQLGPGVRWQALIDESRALVEAEIGQTGTWRCRVHSGVFVCR